MAYTISYLYSTLLHLAIITYAISYLCSILLHLAIMAYAISYLRSILLHLAIMAANKDCDVVWNVEEEVILYHNVLHQVPLIFFLLMWRKR